MKSNNATRAPLLTYLEELLTQFRHNTTGSLADYIPELAKANSEWFGIALATVDGQVYQAGDSRHPFTIQSISKPFTYALTLDAHGIDKTLLKVGVEPSGEAFNEISLEPDTGRPSNPMINAGAIAISGLVPGSDNESRFSRIINTFELFSAHKLEMDESVYRSEADTGNRNRAIAYLLKNSNIIEGNTEAILDLYFRQCSILVTCRDLAVMGATLANNGINPISGVVAMKPENVEKVLSIVSTCGMYNYAGGWIYNIGMPAKSGVSGGIMAVLPGQFGIGVFSPLLDQRGNSARGIEVCRKISMDFGLHMFDSSKASNSVIRVTYDSATITSRRMRSPDQAKILQTHGGRIKIYELAGDLIFSATDYVLQAILSELDAIDCIIFDFKRVTSAKKSACTLISGLINLLHAKGKHIFFTHTDYQFNKLLNSILDNKIYEAVFRFPENDMALEWCENTLLQQYLQPQNANHKVALAEQILFRGFSSGELTFLKSIMAKRSFKKDEIIINEGEVPDSIYFLTMGEVNVKKRGSGNTQNKRISTLSGGMSVGEMSLLDRKARSASVIADNYVECYELTFASFDNEILTKQPQIKDKMLTNIAIDLSEKLRRANKVIRACQ